MNPQLALLLCTIFVIFLLRIEKKQTPEVSFALWVPTIWILSIGSKPLSSWIGWGFDSGGSRVDQIFLLGLLFVGIGVLANRKFNLAAALRNNPWVALLICYMFVSIIWSDIPFTSFKRWIREVLALIMAFIVLSERDPQKALEQIFKRTIYILISFSPVLIKYFPEYGREYSVWAGSLSWTGVALQKNGLGRLCLIAVFFLIWTLVRRWEKGVNSNEKLNVIADVCVLMIALWLLKGPPGGYSATAILTLVVGIASFFSLFWIKKHGVFLELEMKLLSVVIVLIFCFGVATPMLGKLKFGENITYALGRDNTLTARTEIWEDLIPVAMQRPLLGHGFGGFWTPLKKSIYPAQEAHNGYLEILLELGFVGLLLFFVFILWCCRKARKIIRYDFYWASLWICFILMAVIHNISEGSLNAFANHLTASMLFLSFSVRS